jgi:hypothetical protein
MEVQNVKPSGSEWLVSLCDVLNLMQRFSRLTIATLLLDIGTAWTLNASLTRLKFFFW